MKKGLKFVFVFVCAMVMMAGVQAQAQEDSFPNKVNTHIGELTFDHGILVGTEVPQSIIDKIPHGRQCLLAIDRVIELEQRAGTF